MTTALANVLGGYLFLLVLGHFLSDWLPQSHDEAMKKSGDWWARGVHCLTYTFCMLLYIRFLWGAQHYGWLLHTIIGGWLFLTHFFIDTYLPTYWWMRYIRRPPSVVAKGKEGFKEYAQTPLGLVLTIVVDQLWHIMTLAPVASLLHAWAKVYAPLP